MHLSPFFMRIVYGMFYVATYYIFATESRKREQDFFFIDNHERQSFLCESERTERINILCFPSMELSIKYHIIKHK